MAVIYKHLKPCGEVFYIGIGQEEKIGFMHILNNKNNKNYYETIQKKYI